MSATIRDAAKTLMAGLLLFCVPTANAAADQDAGEWSFIIAPYAWLAGTGGTIVTDGEETDFDLSFDDILELTTGGFQINAQARYDRFFLTFDGTWAQLGHGEELLGGRIDFAVKQTIVELQGGYRLIGPAFQSASPDTRPYLPGAVALDAYVGVRYWRTDLSLDVDLPGLPPLIPPTQTAISETDEWYEPLVGARFGIGLTEKVGVAINGNLGGFGIGDAAELTWTLNLFVDWRFGRKWSAAFGWRTQSVNDISGTGAERNGSEIVTTGPIVGFVYSF
jgi:hypothetical protein